MSEHKPSKFMSPAQAAALIRDGDTVGLMGGGGGLMEATCLFEAVQARFLASGAPRDLSVVHALGIGDKKSKGMNCFAHEGLVRRVIGGHWVWSPAMQQLALDNKIEAYILPGGVSSQLMREIGAGRPGLLTRARRLDFVTTVVTNGTLDTSTNNLSVRNPGGRYFRPGGSGVRPNRNIRSATANVTITIIYGIS